MTKIGRWKIYRLKLNKFQNMGTYILTFFRFNFNNMIYVFLILFHLDDKILIFNQIQICKHCLSINCKYKYLNY